MPRVLTKLAVAAVSAAIAALGAYRIAVAYQPNRATEMRRIDQVALAELAQLLRPNTSLASAVLDDGVSPLDADAARFPASVFRRKPLTAEQLARLRKNVHDLRVEYDSFCYERYRPGIDMALNFDEARKFGWRMHTNDLGMREDENVLTARPDLRILVTGDSHTDGVCRNADSFTNVLEARLAAQRPGQVIEALNAGRGGYTFFSYLGVLERFAPLDPDVFVVAVYGGNDFQEVLGYQHLFQGTRRGTISEEQRERNRRAEAGCPGAMSQAFFTLMDFANFPDQIDVALQAARDASTEIVATCMRLGVHPVFVYVPPMPDVEWDEHAERLEQVRETLGLSREDLRITDRMADSYLAFLRQLRVDIVDMRPAFRAADVELYWQHDFHIDVAAHALIAEALVPIVGAAQPSGAVRVRGIAASEPSPALWSPGIPLTPQ